MNGVNGVWEIVPRNVEAVQELINESIKLRHLTEEMNVLGSQIQRSPVTLKNVLVGYFDFSKFYFHKSRS